MNNNIVPLQNSSLTKGILLWGANSKARILIEMLKENGFEEPRLIFDNTITEISFSTSAFFTNDIYQIKQRIHEVSHYVICIGSEHGFARVKTAEYLDRIGLLPLTLVHKRSFIETTSTFGVGCHIMPSSVIHKFSKLGNHTIVNTNATVDHECIIGDGVHIMGSAAIAGKIIIGNYATIGTNATILPFINIGEGAFVGAGAVVTKDIEPYTLVVGVPAKPVRICVPQFFSEPLEQLLA